MFPKVIIASTLTVLITSVLSACSILENPSLEKVKPWERAYLARDNMKIEPDPVEAGFRSHIYSSKEAASGSGSVSGGGCGCN